jgi:carbamoyl-phosphate synthase large subunit
MNTYAEIVVCVTGVGAIIGQGIVRSLRASGRTIRVVGVDRSDRSPGPYMVDSFEQKSVASEDSPEYKAYWEALIQRHGIQIVLPGLEADMVYLDKNRDWFAFQGVQLALNTPDLIRITSNKWEFGKVLADIGYPVIPSVRPDTWQEAVQKLGVPPLLLKPLQGNGSRGIIKLDNERDFEYWSSKTSGDWMLQRIVGEPDEEYTVGVFGLGNGHFIGPLIFRRRLSLAGNTQEAEVVLDHQILEVAVKKLCQHFSPIGPTNLQFRVEGEIAYLLEINPRFSSSNSLRTAFGYNESVMAIDYYLFNREPMMPTLKQGHAWRYYEDFVIHASYPV